MATRKSRVRATQKPPPDDCPLEEVLVLLAGAWTPKILWFLRAGPRRFGDLRRDLRTISAKVLTNQLRKLEANGVVDRTVVPTSPPNVNYALTKQGMKLTPILDAMEDVARGLKRSKARAQRAKRQ
ncbi:MAG: helix-turn-helix domain-containing protein [Myxococcota bacterium]